MRERITKMNIFLYQLRVYPVDIESLNLPMLMKTTINFMVFQSNGRIALLKRFIDKWKWKVVQMDGQPEWLEEGVLGSGKQRARNSYQLSLTQEFHHIMMEWGSIRFGFHSVMLFPKLLNCMLGRPSDSSFGKCHCL
jgi:hypothetical protein